MDLTTPAIAAVLLAILAFAIAWRSRTFQNLWGASLKRKSLILLARGDRDGAIRLDRRALRAFEKAGYDRARVATHIALARLYLNEDAAEAGRHAKIAYEDSAEKPSYEDFRTEASTVLGFCLMQQNKADEAVAYFQESAEKQRELVDTKEGMLKTVSMRTPTPGGGWAIVARPLPEVTVRCARAVFAKTHLAFAHLVAGDQSQARQFIREIVTELEALSDPASERCLMAMRMVHSYDAPEAIAEKRQVRAFLEELAGQCAEVRDAMGKAPGSSAALEKACRILLSFQSGLDQLARATKFSLAGVGDPGPTPRWMR